MTTLYPELMQKVARAPSPRLLAAGDAVKGFIKRFRGQNLLAPTEKLERRKAVEALAVRARPGTTNEKALEMLKNNRLFAALLRREAAQDLAKQQALTQKTRLQAGGGATTLAALGVAVPGGKK